MIKIEYVVLISMFYLKNTAQESLNGPDVGNMAGMPQLFPPLESPSSEELSFDISGTMGSIETDKLGYLALFRDPGDKFKKKKKDEKKSKAKTTTCSPDLVPDPPKTNDKKKGRRGR